MPGKTNPTVVIADADAIISFVNVEDANHHRTKQIMQHLALLQVNLLFPTTAICEAVTVLRGKLNKPDDAGKIIEKLQSGDFLVQAVDQEILSDALTLYNPLASKKNTLFDAVVATLAKRLEAEAIFSFDEWYGKIGLTLASDLIEQREAA